MTASPAITLPDPRGTQYVHGETPSGETSAFYAREPGSGDIHYQPLSNWPAFAWPAHRNGNAKALRAIALEVLSEARYTDPNLAYAKAVHRAILEGLHEADRISTFDLDELIQAFDIAVEHAAHAVAAAWLHERGGIPVPVAGEGSTGG